MCKVEGKAILLWLKSSFLSSRWGRLGFDLDCSLGWWILGRLSSFGGFLRIFGVGWRRNFRGPATVCNMTRGRRLIFAAARGFGLWWGLLTRSRFLSSGLWPGLFSRNSHAAARVIHSAERWPSFLDVGYWNPNFAVTGFYFPAPCRLGFGYRTEFSFWLRSRGCSRMISTVPDFFSGHSWGSHCLFSTTHLTWTEMSLQLQSPAKIYFSHQLPAFCPVPALFYLPNKSYHSWGSRFRFPDPKPYHNFQGP